MDLETRCPCYIGRVWGQPGPLPPHLRAQPGWDSVLWDGADLVSHSQFWPGGPEREGSPVRQSGQLSDILTGASEWKLEA